MSARIFLISLLLPALALPLGACLRKSAQSLGGVQLPMPTKDDLAVVDGRHLTLAMYQSIQRNLSEPNQKYAYWAAKGTLAVQSLAEIEGRGLDPAEALLLVRFALGETSADQARSLLGRLKIKPSETTPSAFRQRIDQTLMHSVINENPALLSELSVL